MRGTGSIKKTKRHSSNEDNNWCWLILATTYGAVFALRPIFCGVLLWCFLFLQDFGGPYVRLDSSSIYRAHCFCLVLLFRIRRRHGSVFYVFLGNDWRKTFIYWAYSDFSYLRLFATGIYSFKGQPCCHRPVLRHPKIRHSFVGWALMKTSVRISNILYWQMGFIQKLNWPPSYLLLVDGISAGGWLLF